MYLWNTGENTSYITVSDEGLYTLIIKTEEGCADTTSVMMYSKASPSVDVPTAFTPNGDSLNDIFCPIVDKDRIRYFTLAIYNKWGQKVFETSDAASGWDGSNTSPGVYAWVISFVDLNENINQLKGSVALIK
jgi:gliding motility-associated-like protein